MIVVARHGKTRWNKIGLMQGQLNSPLTPKGVRQAKQLSKVLENEDWNRLFASPLGRSCHTALIVGHNLNKKIIFDPRLKEIDFGKFTGKSEKDIKKYFYRFWESRDKNKWSVSWPDGESYSSAFQRAESFIESYNELNKDIIISHRSFNRLLVGKMMKYETHKMLSVDQRNNELFLITNNSLEKVRYYG